MAIMVRNVSAGVDLASLTVPTRPDGSYYRYEMLCDGGWTRVYDDTVPGLLSHLIPGYEDMDQRARLASRVRHAVDMQVALQARLNVFFAATPRNSEEQAVLYGARHVQPTPIEWACGVPLVLIDVFYAPFSTVPRPASALSDVAVPQNLWWLNPAEGDLEYLRSLHAASVIDLHVAKDMAV